MRDRVAVGNYKLTEMMPNTDITTGKSASYVFNIYGEGNISSIQKPNVVDNANFEFYEPNVRMDIKRENGRVHGTKSFNYFLIPKEPGRYDLKDYFQWVFFNPEVGKYDTLKSKLTVYVTGESMRNEAIEANDDGSFYDKIQTADNSLTMMHDSGWVRTAFSVFIFLVLGTSAFLVFRK
jgi:hypothetical protein